MDIILMFKAIAVILAIAGGFLVYLGNKDNETILYYIGGIMFIIGILGIIWLWSM